MLYFGISIIVLNIIIIVMIFSIYFVLKKYIYNVMFKLRDDLVTVFEILINRQGDCLDLIKDMTKLTNSDLNHECIEKVNAIYNEILKNSENTFAFEKFMKEEINNKEILIKIMESINYLPTNLNNLLSIAILESSNNVIQKIQEKPVTRKKKIIKEDVNVTR